MNVIVLGLGSIGLGNRNIRSFKSYVNFFLKSKKYKLYAVVDPNPKKLMLYNANFKKKNVLILKNLRDLKKEQSKKIDIVCFATPTKYFIPIFNQLNTLGIKPKIVIIEKPVATTIKNFRKIILNFKKSKIIINYQRIFDKNYRKIFDNLKKKKNLNFDVNYNNGLFENLCHLLSLIIFYFGNPTKIIKKKEFKKTNFKLIFKNNIEVNCNEVNKHTYNILDMIVYEDKQKINFFSAGHHIIKEKIYHYDYLFNYKLLKKNSEFRIKQIFSLDFLLSKKYNKFLEKKLIKNAEETIRVINKVI